MKIERCRCFSRPLVVLLASFLLPACCLSSLKMPKVPWWFGGRDRTKPEVEEKPVASVPGNRVAGVVHLVNDRGHFVLVKSLSGGKMDVAEGTVWMSYGPNGKPSAKLEVSAERKGVFVVADIVEGVPDRGDSVVLHGLMNKKGEVITVTTPDGKKKQVLE